jgi:DNA-binding MarR family transcriptional regulator
MSGNFIELDNTSSMEYSSYMNQNRDEDEEKNILVLKSILHAGAFVEGRLEAALAGTGLSLSKFAALDRLMKAGEPLLLTRLAGQLSCVKSNITQLIDRLEAEGLVERKDDPEDRRSVLAAITDEGQHRHEVGDRVLTAAAKELLKPFKEDELELLNNLLGRFDKC